NKADGDLLAAASRAQADYRAALQLLRPPNPPWTPEVLACSTLEVDGSVDGWHTIRRHHAALEQIGCLATKHARPTRSWLMDEVKAALADTLRSDPATADLIATLEDDVRRGRLLPPQAARTLVARFRTTGSA